MAPSSILEYCSNQVLLKGGTPAIQQPDFTCTLIMLFFNLIYNIISDPPARINSIILSIFYDWPSSEKNMNFFGLVFY